MTTLHGFEEQLAVDTTERDPVFLLTTDDGRYLRFSGSAYHLLRMANRGLSMEEIAEQFSRAGDRPVTAEQVVAAHARLMERVNTLARPRGPSVLGLRWPRRIIPASVVRRISGMLRGAFRWPVATALLACVGCATVVALHERSLGPTRLADLVFSHLWSGYTLFLISLIAHEFGHAAACTRYGARPAEIGVGIYFIYPALYSDVTDAWRLSRWQRVVVDVGGVYFQLIVGAAFVFGFEATGYEPFLAASVFVAANCLFSLNPILKFDGYWLITDALGVTNLQADARRVAGALWDRVRGRRTAQLRWSPGIAAAVLVLGGLATATWAMFMVRVVPRLIMHLVGYPRVAIDFIWDLAHGHGLVTLSGVLNFLLATYFVVVGSRMLYSQLKRLSLLLMKAVRISLPASGQA